MLRQDGISYGNDEPSPTLEDAAGVLDHLLRLGIHFSGDPRRRPRGSTVPACGDSISHRRPRTLRLDARARRALAERTAVGIRISARAVDLLLRLRPVVLGRAARSL